MLPGERVRALFGAAHGYVAEPDGLPTGSYTPYSQTKFAASFGSAIDVKMNRRMSMRVSPAMYMTTFAGTTQQNFRLSVGPVFHLGGER